LNANVLKGLGLWC